MTYGKNPNNSWYCYNDSMCKVCYLYPHPFKGGKVCVSKTKLLLNFTFGIFIGVKPCYPLN